MSPRWVTALAAAACGGGSTENAGAGDARADGQSRSTRPRPATSPARITFEGSAAEARSRSDGLRSELRAAGRHATTRLVVVGDGGALQNVFVYVKDGLGDLRFPVPATPVVLDQKGCHYVPHVLGVQVGQPRRDR